MIVLANARSLYPGKDADLVVLDDGLHVAAVLARGTLVHGVLP